MEILGFLIFPFIPVMLFMFINFVAELLETRLSKILKNIFFVFWGFIIFVYMFFAVRFFVTRDSGFLMEMRAATYLLEGLILFSATFFLLIKARMISDKNRRKAILTIGTMYFFILVFYIVLFVRLIIPTLYLFLILHFSFNIPPLIYLGVYLKKFDIEAILPGIKTRKMENFFENHNITQREREVFLLILKGKRTKDIEKELFISYHTAKNHIHNIYQKLNVQNRLQAANFLRD